MNRLPASFLASPRPSSERGANMKREEISPSTHCAPATTLGCGGGGIVPSCTDEGTEAQRSQLTLSESHS